MEKIIKITLFLTFFCLPFSFFIILNDNFSYFYSNFSIWTTVGVYFSDVFFLLFCFFIFLYFGISIFQEEKISNISKAQNNFFLFGLIKKIFFRKKEITESEENPFYNKKNYSQRIHIRQKMFLERSLILTIFFVLISIFLIIPFFYSQNYIYHLFFYTKFLLLLFIFLFTNESFLDKRIIIDAILLSIFFQVFVAIYQFFSQESFGFYFLGESQIGQNILGVAKIDIGAEKIIRSYGTFSHPNILGFFALFGYFISRYHYFPVIRYFFIIGIFLSFSSTAWLLFLLLVFLDILKKNKGNFFALICFFGFFGFFFNLSMQKILNSFGDSLSQRIDQWKLSLEIFFSNIFGVGFGNYTMQIDRFSSEILPFWQIQPVHNSFLLFLAEGGVFALILFILIFIFSIKKISTNKFYLIIFLLIYANFDHLILTSNGIFILFFILRILSDEEERNFLEGVILKPRKRVFVENETYT